jgi:glycerol-1-phosphate dehydrogenase [NAD(P)+]
MNLPFDPGDIQPFRQAIEKIPGYPVGEDLPIRAMIFESNALFRLPELLTLAGADPQQPLLVVMDRTPMQRAGADLKPLIMNLLSQAGWPAEALWLEPGADGQVHTDFLQIERVGAWLRPGVAVLSVGSGVVTDVAKHACYVHQQQTSTHLPFVIYQTANSVSAYTSNMAPVFVEGVKRTLTSRYPDVLICDLETLRDAPPAMTVAGVGDLLAAFSSFADWRLAHQLGLDPTYNTFAQTLMGPLDELFLEEAPAIRDATLAGMETLAKLIALGGLAMSLSHATAPLSGFEHVISHVLDLLAERAHRPLAQHGTQVALATRLATSAYEIFLNEFEPTEVNLAQCYPTAEHMRARLETAFQSIDPSGQVAAECWADYELKLEAWHQQRPRFEAFLRDWPRQRLALQALFRPPAVTLQILRAIQAPLAFEQLTPPASAEQVKFAFLNAPLIRRRLTLGDLFILLNWDRETLWANINAPPPGLPSSPDQNR